jgi:hypothetical protein
MIDMINVYKIVVSKPDVKRPLVRSRRRCEDNVRIDLREIGGKVWTGFVWL